MLSYTHSYLRRRAERKSAAADVLHRDSILFGDYCYDNRKNAMPLTGFGQGLLYEMATGHPLPRVGYACDHDRCRKLGGGTRCHEVS